MLWYGKLVSPKSWESKPNAAEARARENSQTGTRIVRDTRNDLKRGHGITGLTDRLDNKPKKIWKDQQSFC